MLRRLRAPLWFHLACAIGVALLLRHLTPAPPDGPQVYSAWWMWVVIAAEAIWSGIQAVADVTVAILHWLILTLWKIVEAIHDGLIELGHGVLIGLQRSWEFLRATYEDVLKPAWQKFWQFFDRFRKWLTDTFAPVLKFLHAVRDDILCFYQTWIRPVFDVIDAVRGILKVLEKLHVPFAQALDDTLGNIETWINRQFNLVLSKVNEVINVVNRIVTLDGLLQRLAFIRTIERDVLYVHRVLSNARMRPLSGEEQYKHQARMKPQSTNELLDQLGRYIDGEQNDTGAVIDAAVARANEFFDATWPVTS